jgi:type VI secretion system protein ImpB
MSKDSIHKKMGRVRPPRVHITYDVETGGAIKQRDLPFVVGVLADLGGESERSVKLSERRFTELNPDNFNDVMSRIKPRITLNVKNTLQEEGGIVPLELKFKKLQDFEPQNVAKQIGPLKALVEERKRLTNMRNSLPGNEKLGKYLEEVLKNTELQNRLRTEMGPEETEPEPEKED